MTILYIYIYKYIYYIYICQYLWFLMLKARFIQFISGYTSFITSFLELLHSFFLFLWMYCIHHIQINNIDRNILKTCSIFVKVWNTTCKSQFSQRIMTWDNKKLIIMKLENNTSVQSHFHKPSFRNSSQS